MSRIDEGIENQSEANWRFNTEVVKVFDSHVRKSVPMYDEFHSMIADLSQWFIEEGTNVYDIGTSTGEGLKNVVDVHKGKNINFIGIDESKDMFEEAKERFKDYSNIGFINGDISNEDIVVSNASVVTAILTLQFIPKRKRQSVINKIYNGLNDGGALIIIEKVIGSNARFDEMFIELYHDFKLKQGFSEGEVFSKSRAIRGVMQPNTVSENIKLLDKAGFKDIDIFFKWCNFVGMIAIK